MLMFKKEELDVELAESQLAGGKPLSRPEQSSEGGPIALMILPN